MIRPIRVPEMRCQRCGAELQADVAAGLCPRCLLLRALAPAAMPAQAAAIGPADTVPEPGPPRFIGSYELIEEIARGGMGVVFRAREHPLGRMVALKLLQAGEWASADLLQRFHTEARAASLLVHPNIVPVYAYGEDAGRWHIAMRLVEGGSLADRGRRGETGPGSRVDPKAAAGIVRKVAEAVHYAHQRGVLHRDLKPGNVLIDAAGEPHLTDFGLARLQDGGSSVTRSYAALGTPAYVAPEIARGGAAEGTVRSDVYGLGAILYELLTGQPPFDGPTPFEILRRVSEAEIRRPSVVLRGVDRDLETICLKALAREPAARYESCEAMARDLARWQGGHPIEARAAGALERSWKWARRRPLTASLLGLLALAVLVITVGSWQVGRNLRAVGEHQRLSLVRLNVETANRLVAANDHAASLRYQVEALQLDSTDPDRGDLHRIRLGLTLREMPELARIWKHDGPASGAVFTADERTVVSASLDGTVRLWSIDDGKPGPILRHPKAVTHAFPSADGRHVVTFSEDGLARCWDAAAGTLRFEPWPVFVFDFPLPRSATDLFDPRRSLVVTTHESRVEIRDLTSGRFHCPPLEVGEPTVHAAFNAEGSRIVVTCRSGRVQTWEVGTSGLSRVSELRLPREVLISGFSRDGLHAVTLCDLPLGVVWDTRTGVPVGAPFRHDTHLRLPQAMFGPLDNRLLTMSYDGSVRVWEGLSGSPVSREIRHHDIITMARWDATGRRIVTASKDRTAAVWDANLGRLILPLLRHGAYVVDVDMAPSGTRVVTADQEGYVRLWIVPPQGGRVMDEGAKDDSPVSAAFFDAAGTRLATAMPDGLVAVRRIGMATSGPVILRHPAPVSLGAFDPGGKRIVTFDGAPGGLVRVWDADRGELLRESRASPGMLRSLDFDQDGSRFVTTGAAAAPSTGSRIILWRTADLEMRTMASPGDEEVHQASFSPDGRFLLTTANLGKTRLWDVATGQELGPAIPGGHEFQQARFSPDGQWLATVGGNGGFASQPAMLWSVATHQPATSPLVHQDGTLAAMFSPDGRVLATGGEDSTARLWEVPSGRPLTSPMLHENVLLHVLFDTTGRILATSTRAGTVRFWDARTGQPLRAPDPLGRAILDLKFVRDSPEFVAVDDQGQLHRWDLSPIRDSLEALHRRTALLNGTAAP